MNTTDMTKPAPRAGLYARAVAQATGLSELDLYRLQPADMGAPGHFTYDAGARGGIFYTVKAADKRVPKLNGSVVAALSINGKSVKEIAAEMDVTPSRVAHCLEETKTRVRKERRRPFTLSELGVMSAMRNRGCYISEIAARLKASPNMVQRHLVVIFGAGEVRR